MESTWAKSKEDVLKYFNVDENKGYSDEQVKKAQEKYGPNGMSVFLALTVL
jgi:Ca2+ transporting ATPase